MENTLLLVDDHPLFRRGVKKLIEERCEAFSQVVEASTADEALTQTERHAPVATMLDIAMPGTDGLQTLERLKRSYPSMICVMLSMYDRPEFIASAHQKGAQGYVLKTDPESVILECLNTVMRGQRYISTAINQSHLASVSETPDTALDIEGLSEREKQVMRLIAINRTSKEIASQLKLSLRTVQNHRLNICKKLGITGPNALLKTAIENQNLL